MKTQIRLFFISVVLFASTAHAQAPSWSNAQSEVWTYVQQSWVDDAAENGKWPGEYAHEKFMAWGDSYAAPRDKEAAATWERMDAETTDIFWHEITPLGIVIEGDTAVVMYLAQVGEESDKGGRSLVPYSVVEVLRRDGENWQFLATTSFRPNYGN